MEIKVGDKVRYRWTSDDSYADHLEIYPELYNGAVFTVTESYPFKDDLAGSYVYVEEIEHIIFFEEIKEVVND